jgi:uncharacterized Zn-binding protein involved in type VI secretion
MGQPAAKRGDQVTAQDTHIVMVPGSPPAPTPLPHPFAGVINGGLSTNVNIMKQPAATVGSTAVNQMPHFPTPAGVSFQKPPSNQGTIQTGSASVFINRKAAARHGDVALTCNDPVDVPIGRVVVLGAPTVMIG